MMTGRHIIGTLLLALLLCGCQERYTQPALTMDLVLKFGTPLDAELETKGLEDGDTFHNLLVLVARGNQILHRVTWPADGSADSYVSDVTIRVPDVEMGAYEVYAYANYEQTDWQDVTIASTELVTPIGQNVNPDRRLKGLSTSMPAPQPPASGKPMLLTGHAQVSVGVANNVGTVELQRPVARLNVYLNNHTPYSVRLDKLSFNSFFAGEAFLIGRTDDAGLPVTPSSTLGALPAYNTSAPVELAAEEVRKLVYTTLMYEMVMPGSAPCRVYAKVSMEKGAEPYPFQEMGTEAQGTVMKKIDNQTSQVSYLTYIARNQELNVEINVYYKTVHADLVFQLDNTFWTTTGHSSSHTYK